VAVVEVTGITEEGLLIPATSVVNNKTWLDLADMVILEVNSRHPLELERMYDIYDGTRMPPHRTPILMTRPQDRIGEPYLKVDHSKVVAVVATDLPDQKFHASTRDQYRQWHRRQRRLCAECSPVDLYDARHG
jgi:succinyl-CoA:acetate CoA-transferase